MRIASIRSMDISNGPGIGIALFTQGCPIRCFNCFNSELWDYDGGREWNSKEDTETIIELLRPIYIKRITILGGEPFIDRNIEPLTNLVTKIREVYGKSKLIWMYSGQMFENLYPKYASIISKIDKLIDGPYIDELKDYRLQWCGSTNQRVLDIEDLLK